jgi:hypothetical protein
LMNYQTDGTAFIHRSRVVKTSDTGMLLKRPADHGIRV